MKYAHVVRALTDSPWEILPDTLQAIVDVVALRSSGGLLSDQEIQARIGAGPARRSSYVAGDVAVLPLYGVLFPRANLFSEMSGGTSVQQWGSEFQQLVDDPRVGAILIDVNSPGGSTSLITETAQRIRAARGSKPIVAVANTTMASAAYHLASQADEIVASPSAIVGSIGVFMAHDDLTGANEKDGIKTTLISAGKYKTEGQPLEPLTDEARASFQELVDDTYAAMINDIASGRGVTADTVRGGYGEGRALPARRAAKAGLVDRVATFDDVLAGLSAPPASSRNRPGARAQAPSAEAPHEEPSGEETSDDDVAAEIAASRADWRTQRERTALAGFHPLGHPTRKD